MNRTYDPITESTDEQTADTLAEYVAEHLNSCDIPLRADQAYLIAEAIAQDGGVHEAWAELVGRLRRS